MSTVNPVEIIRRKRDGKRLSFEELESFVREAATGKIPSYQVTAFLMATFFQGMTSEETASLTKAMMLTGKIIKFKDSDSTFYVDKHSTGGIGDKISIILAPLVASLGLKTPMVAGRGLAHTGGTLDKLESIPGFSVNLSIEQFMAQIEKTGTAIKGQTQDFVPADKLFYALRDVTATVDNISLITASILSKKAAEGISGLVLDVKVGKGAFMKTVKDAEDLAKSLLRVGKQLGLKIHALLTDMNAPLGYAVGNSLEIYECLDIFFQAMGQKGSFHPLMPTLSPVLSQEIKDLTIELASHMLVLGEKTSSLSAGRILARKALKNGDAFRKFLEICREQGCKIDLSKNPEVLPISKEYIDVTSPENAYLEKIDPEGVGLLVVDLGGGRHRAEDEVDPSVGMIFFQKPGAKIKKNQRLARIYFSSTTLKALGWSEDILVTKFLNLYQWSKKKPPLQKLIKKVLTT